MSHDAPHAALLIEFVDGTTLVTERDRPSELPIYRNGPPGTFVWFPHGLRVSLPTDQVVCAEDASGRARVGLGGMRWVGSHDGHLVFSRVRELHPEEQLSPARSHTMILASHLVSSVVQDGRPVWPL